MRDGSRGRGHVLRALLASAMLVLVVAGCSSNDDEQDYIERPVDELYNEALDQLRSGRISGAAVLVPA